MSIERKRRPTHPGELLREEILPACNLSQVGLAHLMGVSRRTISEIVHERRPITIDTAHRLARVFKTTPEFWLNMQQAVGVWEVLKSNQKEYDRIKPLTKTKVA